MLQDVKRGRYHKLQSTDPSLLVVATNLGIQTESGARTAGVSVLPAETVRSLMIDKRKVQAMHAVLTAYLGPLYAQIPLHSVFGKHDHA